MWVSAPAHQTRSPPSRVRIWVLAPLWKFLVWGTVTSPSACSTTDNDQGCVSGSQSSGSGCGPRSGGSWCGAPSHPPRPATAWTSASGRRLRVTEKLDTLKGSCVCRVKALSGSGLEPRFGAYAWCGAPSHAARPAAAQVTRAGMSVPAESVSLEVRAAACVQDRFADLPRDRRWPSSGNLGVRLRRVPSACSGLDVWAPAEGRTLEARAASCAGT